MQDPTPSKKQRKRKTEDYITTGLGVASAVALVLAENGYNPQAMSGVSALALAAMGYFTNKPLFRR